MGHFSVITSPVGGSLLLYQNQLFEWEPGAKERILKTVRRGWGERGVFRYQLSIPEIVPGIVSGLGRSRESIYSENRNREGSFGRGIVGYLARRLTGYPLKSVAEHFGRDPVAISQGVGKLETRLREDDNLGRRITDLVEKLPKGRTGILIELCLTPRTCDFGFVTETGSRSECLR